MEILILRSTLHLEKFWKPIMATLPFLQIAREEKKLKKENSIQQSEQLIILIKIIEVIVQTLLNLNVNQPVKLEVFIKIDVKDNNVEQAIRVLKRKLQKEGFFKVMKMKSTYEKPSERKKRIKTENLKRIKKQQKLRNRY